jgi:peptide deformylase
VASRRIRLLGDPALRVRAQPVQDPRSPAARLVADDLRDSLHAARKRHGMGRAIAAPQIGAPVRVILIETERRRITMVNPEVVDVGADDFVVWDDCFCFPELVVRVTRAHDVAVRYFDTRGTERVLEARGSMAELVQHEIDHLDGILAVDRAAGLDPFAYRSEWEKYHSTPGRYGPATPRDII